MNILFIMLLRMPMTSCIHACVHTFELAQPNSHSQWSMKYICDTLPFLDDSMFL